MFVVAVLLGLMFFTWGVAIWATFNESEPDSREREEQEEHDKRKNDSSRDKRRSAA